MSRIASGIVLFIAVLASLSSADNPCRFEVAGKGVIDISSLARKDGKAAFPDESPSIGSNYLYSYNPCKPFTEGDDCKDVAVCQVSKDKQYTFVLGKHDSAKWTDPPGTGANPTLDYSFGEKHVTISLLCDESDKTGQLVALGEGPTNNYKFSLTHQCICWNKCKSSGSDGGHGISGGAVFIIILLVLAVVYFVGFAIYNKVHHHRTGMDIIAHRTFWVALPGQARDGATYVFRRATGKGGLEYNKI